MLQTSVKNPNDQYNTNLKQMLFDEAFLFRSENNKLYVAREIVEKITEPYKSVIISFVIIDEDINIY